jgi:hypothetical protein
MKKLLAVMLSLALAFPAAGVLAQQAKQQPVQTAQAGAAGGGLFGMGVGATVAIIAVAVLAVAAASDDDDTLPPATASGTR